MRILLHPVALVQILGLGGGLAALLGVLISGAAYVGTAGERYSPLNHFISELGEVGVSRLARVFNVALMLAGLLLAPCCIFMGLLIPGWLAKVAMVAGVGAAAALGLVGVYPMNNITPHVRAAMTFFRLGLAMALLFTLAIATQGEPNPAIPRSAAWASVPAILSYAAFLGYSGWAFRNSEGGGLDETFANRPRIWPLAILEWLIFVTTTLWFGAIAFTL